MIKLHSRTREEQCCNIKEAVISNLHDGDTGSDGFLGEFCQILEGKIIPILHSLSESRGGGNSPLSKTYFTVITIKPVWYCTRRKRSAPPGDSHVASDGAPR